MKKILNMKFAIFLLFLSIPFAIYSQTPKNINADGLTGKIIRYEKFQSKFVDPRNVDVWIPSDYAKKKKYSVIYMHDGQNLFIPKLSYTKIDWGVDETVTRLVKENKIKDTIVVGIWNTPKRVLEYMPQKAIKYATKETLAKVPKQMVDSVVSDNYLKFIVKELKPFIDKNYKTKTDKKNTFIMGSSMGGLISCYALSEYPKIFGGAGCVSTHYPAGEGAFIEYFRNNLQKPNNHKVYFDFGTEKLDAQYEPYQNKMDVVMKEKGWTKGKNWITKKFEGADHSERAWKERIHIPIEFFLGK